MNPRFLLLVFLACVALTLPVSACKHGGGAPPCPTQGQYLLRSADAVPAGTLTVASTADGLIVTFQSADGRPFDGAYLIGSSDGDSRLSADRTDGVLVVPWDGLADDVCGQTLTIAIEALPTETVTYMVTCPQTKTAYATSTGGGGGGGGYCQP